MTGYDGYGLQLGIRFLIFYSQRMRFLIRAKIPSEDGNKIDHASF
jgi:hypothetical protein